MMPPLGISLASVGLFAGAVFLVVFPNVVRVDGHARYANEETGVVLLGLWLSISLLNKLLVIAGHPTIVLGWLAFGLFALLMIFAGTTTLVEGTRSEYYQGANAVAVFGFSVFVAMDMCVFVND